jgi:hypothetical protein
LKKVVIEKGVAKIDYEAFAHCHALEEVVLPIGVAKIDETLFEDCENLKTIVVPSKKADYYKDRLPGILHELIVEVAAEKKSTKKK